MKREQILAEIQIGLDQLDRGEGSAYDEAGLDALAERIKRATRRAGSKRSVTRRMSTLE